MFNLRKFSPRSFDWYLLVAVLLLILMGLAAIYSVDLSRGSELVYFRKQIIALGVGLILLFFSSMTQLSFWVKISKWWYLLALGLLLLVLIIGQNIRGTKGWFVLSGYSFQPVEFAKIGLILMLAYIISRFGRRFERPLFFFGTGIVAFLSVVLVLAQPDLGSAILLVMIWFGLMLIVGARRLFVLIFMLAATAVAIAAWFFLLQDYQKSRLLNFVHPDRDPLGSGYNITQSIIAIGSGQIFGRGLGFGSQSQLRFLPETQTDFIFSVVAEELGLAGVSAMILLFAVIFWRLFTLLNKTGDDYKSIVVSGALVLLFGQFFTNVGANLGLLPITGVTLPFVSYGGSSLAMTLLLIGILESMVVKKYA